MDPRALPQLIQKYIQPAQMLMSEQEKFKALAQNKHLAKSDSSTPVQNTSPNKSESLAKSD